MKLQIKMFQTIDEPKKYILKIEIYVYISMEQKKFEAQWNDLIYMYYKFLPANEIINETIFYFLHKKYNKFCKFLILDVEVEAHFALLV